MTPSQLAKPGHEHSHQRALFAWSNVAYRHGLWFANHNEAYEDKEWIDEFSLSCEGIPQLKWLHAIHNQGHGDAVRGAKAKAEGVKPGVADLFLPVTKLQEYGINSLNYAGLYIELKKLSGSTISSEQKDFREHCEIAGYRHEFCYGWKSARDVIIAYLGLTPEPDAL